MKFADILASLIHDMKNSLGMVINTLDELTHMPALDASSQRGKMTALQQEAKRLNSNLIELLTLYKIENERISANVEEINIAELLEEVVLDAQAIARTLDVDLTWSCDPDLDGYFDEGLVRGVLNNLIGNGLRYTYERLQVVADKRDGYLVLTVQDDGDGFPQAMLEAQDHSDQAMDAGTERTHLGIYFSRMVAELHHNGEQRGYIRLSNDCPLGGGSFSLFLP